MEQMRMALVPLKWTSGRCEMRRREQPLGVMVNLLFFLRFFVRGARTPRFAHSTPPRVEDPMCCSLRPRTGFLSMTALLYFPYATYFRDEWRFSRNK
jgi:hypothetical protein